MEKIGIIPNALYLAPTCPKWLEIPFSIAVLSNIFKILSKFHRIRCFLVQRCEKLTHHSCTHRMYARIMDFQSELS